MAPVPLVPKDSFLKRVGEENRGELANPGGPGMKLVQ